MKYEVTTPPAATPVSWSDAAAHLRLSGTDEQAYVETLIGAAADFAESAMATSLTARTITATFYAGERLHLPRGPVADVVSVTDANGKAVTDFDVERVGFSDRIVTTVPFVAPLTVVYAAGYPTPSAVPASIRLGILCHVATLYENRESVSDKARAAVPHQLEAFYRLKCRSSGVA